VHALPGCWTCWRHLFNWHLWPDFREIPSAEAPWLRFVPLALGEAFELKGRSFRPLPVNHVVPACGLHVTTEEGSLVFSGDTTHSDAFVAALNAIPDLRHLIIETSFENALVDTPRRRSITGRIRWRRNCSCSACSPRCGLPT
jgi:Cft2 family RNA processing exonuclease